MENSTKLVIVGLVVGFMVWFGVEAVSFMSGQMQPETTVQQILDQGR